MIQSRIPYRDMIHAGGWGFTPDRHDSKPEIKPNFTEIAPIDTQHSVFLKKELFEDPYKWQSSGQRVDTLYEGMLVYVTDEMKMYYLADVDKWRTEEAWLEYDYDQAEQDEFIRLKKLDNLLK